MTVLAATRWGSNGDLIADVAKLGYLKRDDLVLDPTYNRGLWWTKWRPKYLVRSDLRINGVDFRNLPWPDEIFDVVAFDPPYVSKGGRETSTIDDFYDRFGLGDAPKTPAGVQQLINDGITEAHRVLIPRGILLVKCKDYVSSGKFWHGAHKTGVHLLETGFQIVDRLEYIGSPGPQPGGRRQVHARRNLSTLFVAKKVPASR